MTSHLWSSFTLPIPVILVFIFRFESGGLPCFWLGTPQRRIIQVFQELFRAFLTELECGQSPWSKQSEDLRSGLVCQSWSQDLLIRFSFPIFSILFCQVVLHVFAVIIIIFLTRSSTFSLRQIFYYYIEPVLETRSSSSSSTQSCSRSARTSRGSQSRLADRSLHCKITGTFSFLFSVLSC